MSIPTIYRSDDTNAPVLNGIAGSLGNLLTKCLVDGYDDKPGAGWTKEFTNIDETITAFKNSPVSGNGVFLRVDEVAAAATHANFQGYESMSDIDAGLQGFFSGITECRKSYSADTTARAWLLAADDKFFYLFVYYYSTDIVNPVNTSHNAHIMGFGDFVANQPTDGFNSLAFTAWNHGLTGTSYHEGPLFEFDQLGGSGNPRFAAPRFIDGTPNTQANLLCVAGGGPRVTTEITNVAAIKAPTYDGNQLIIARPFISEPGNVILRGWIPGAYTLCHKADTFEHLSTVTAPDGTTFLYLLFNVHLNNWEGTYYSEAAFLLQTGAEWN